MVKPAQFREINIGVNIYTYLLTLNYKTYALRMNTTCTRAHIALFVFISTATFAVVARNCVFGLEGVWRDSICFF